MVQILIILVFYSICASVVLVWGTLLDESRATRIQMLRGGVELVAIADYSFFERAKHDQNLVIFDLHTDCGIGGRLEFISYWLPISTVDLPGMLKWLPPGSGVVFCCKDATDHLDVRTKTILLQLGIGTVYFLDETPTLQGIRCCDAEFTTNCAHRQLAKRAIETRRRRL